MRKLVWVFVITSVIVFGAFSVEAVAADAATTFDKTCSMCHGKLGAGGPMAPALKENEFIKGDVDPIKDTIKNGRVGDAKLYAETFSMPMPKFDKMTDAEVDDMVKYLKGL